MRIKYLSLLLFFTTSINFLSTNVVYGETSLSSEKTFLCESDSEMPTTLAKTNSGQDITIFNWHAEVFPVNTNLQEICMDVSEKLEDYLSSREDSYFGNFKTIQMDNIPAICLTDDANNCDLILFTLAPKEEPIAAANLVLDSILNPNLKVTKLSSSERGVQSTAYNVSLWELLGLNFIDSPRN